MECNKEEALRAKEIAEKKFTEGNIDGAKRFAMKAQNLYPELDGLSQFLATLDMYISAEKGINGEVDWYRVLGVESSADDEAIRRSYRNLALILHPDKNQSVGADGAFKILSQAWSLLSDRAKRIDYDQKRNLRETCQKVPSWKSPVRSGQNGYHNFSNNINSHPMSRSSTMHPKPPRPPYFAKSNTFWTICDSCKTQFEYARVYLNHNLLCPNCRKPFFAVEVPPPPISGNGPSTTWTEKSFASRKKPVPATHMGPAVQSGAFSEMGSDRRAPSTFPSQVENLKGKHEEAPTALKDFLHPSKKMGMGLATGSFNASSSSVSNADGPKKGRHVNKHGVNSYEKEMAHQATNRNGGAGKSGSQQGSFETGRGHVGGSYKSKKARELSPESKRLFQEKAKKELFEKLKSWSSVATVSRTAQAEMTNEKNGKEKAVVTGMKGDASGYPDIVDAKTRVQTNESVPGVSAVEPYTKGTELLSMSVPDPDFHDFDKDRTEKSFGNNQVWAAYDDTDGMPRYYAMIHSVISLKPFKIQISWLNSKSSHEFGPLNWIGAGFYKTSGKFWIGKHEVNKSLNSFSHKVKWTKGNRGIVEIYPRKGDVWALYKNWSPDWDMLTPIEVRHKYDMVEVLEDYNEEKGATVTPLVKVPGFKTVFQRHSASSKIRTVPREEMFRFSHQVPACLLTGQEGLNAPRGCWELDPASTPLELLQVLTEIQLDEMVETAEDGEEKDPSRDAKESEAEQLVANRKTNDKESVMDAADRKEIAYVRKNKGKEIMEDKMMVYKRRR